MWHLISAVLKSLFRIIWSYFAFLLPYSKKIDKIDLSKRYSKVRNLVTHVNKNLKLDIIVEGKENIIDGACYYGNHLSMTDPLPIFNIFDKPIAFLGKIEITKYPFAGKALKVGGGLFLDRENLKQQLKIMMKVQDSLQKHECSWMIFPEGTRNKDQQLNIPEFHHGTFRAAMKAKVPLIPVVNYGTFRILDTSCSLKSYPVIIKFLTPIYPEEYEGKSTEEIALIVHSRIQKELTYNVRPKYHDIMVKNHKNKYSFNKIY